MFTPYTIFVGARYTSSKRGSRLTTFLSRTAIAGLVIGVALLIVVLSVMNGFEREMRERILGLVPHISLYAADPDVDWRVTASRVEEIPGVTSASPLLQLNAMLVNGQSTQATLLFGIDPERERKATALARFLPEETIARLAQEDEVIVLGQGLAHKLGIDIGGRVTVMVPDRDTQTGNIQPHIARFTLIGLIQSGTELDESLALLRLDAAQKLMGDESNAIALRVSVDDLFAAPQIAGELWRLLEGKYYASDWTSSQGNLYAAISLSKRLVGMMLAIIIAVAAFNVVSALVLVVNDKHGDVAILMSQGATSRDIMKIFLVQGFLVGVIGTAAGVVGGVGLSLVITDLIAGIEHVLHIQFLRSDVYPISYLPSDIRWIDVLYVAGTALLMSMLAAIYPAWRAAKIEPALALRYD
ncbi:MAG: lipoprotein-releasing ABC transporter permease subunit [Spongiibacteraceae bacterium]